MSLFSGQRAFVAQRLSALALLAAVAAAALRVAFGGPLRFEQWQAWSASPAGSAILLALAACLIVHAWVGLRDVVLDYVRPAGLRLAVLAGAALALAGLAAWITLVIVRHAISYSAI